LDSGEEPGIKDVFIPHTRLQYFCSLFLCLKSGGFGMKFSYLCRLLIKEFGVDWFRQQDQWVSKHAENRSAISLIPCCRILTGNEEYALAA